MVDAIPLHFQFLPIIKKNNIVNLKKKTIYRKKNKKKSKFERTIHPFPTISGI